MPENPRLTRKLTWVAAVLLVAAIGLYWYTSRANHQAVSLLAFHPKDLDLPTLPEGAEHTKTIRLTNTTAQPVKLLKLGASCNCLGVEPSEAEFAPNETKSFELKYRAEAKANAAVNAAGVLSDTIQLAGFVIADGMTEPQTITSTLQVAVKTSCELRPETVELGTQSIRREALTQFTLVKLFPPATSFSIQDHPHWSFEPAQFQGEEKQVILIAKQPNTPRVIKDEIVIQPKSSTGELLPSKTLRITGELKSDIAARPALLHSGRVPLGDTIDERIQLESLSGAEFTAAVETPTPGVKVTALADGRTFDVQYTASTSGEQTVPVVFTIYYGQKEKSQTTIHLHYYGEDGQ